MINVAGQMFIRYEKELEQSNQIIQSFEKYIVDDKTKNDV